MNHLALLYFQAAGDGLHGDAAAAGVGDAVLRVNGDGECVAESHGSEAHFNADQEILIARGDGTGVGFGKTVRTVNRRDEFHFFQNGQQYSCRFGI